MLQILSLCKMMQANGYVDMRLNVPVTFFKLDLV